MNNTHWCWDKIRNSNSTFRTFVFLTIIIAVGLLTLAVFSPTKAQSPTLKKSLTPSSVPTDIINKLKQIKILKEKIATKVAEIRKKDKKAFLGTVKKIQKSTITISNYQGDQTISFSDDTLFYAISKKKKSQASIEKIKEGDIISTYGYLSEDKKTLSAKFIYLQTPILHVSGKIADKDNKNYTITVSTTQGSLLIDIEKYTKSYTFTKDKTKKRTGFSKLKLGEVIHLIGTPHAKEEGRIHALEILTISLPVQATPSPAKSSTNSASPSGKKLN